MLHRKFKKQRSLRKIRTINQLLYDTMRGLNNYRAYWKVRDSIGSLSEERHTNLCSTGWGP